jgi:hypothetical protein
VKRFLALVVVVATPALILAACTTNGLTAKGGTCFQTIDCGEGLICKYANDAGTCTDDLSGLNTLPAEAAADAPAQVDAPNDGPVQDTGTQDTGTQDTGTQDTGTQDTGTQDTGTSDAGNG